MGQESLGTYSKRYNKAPSTAAFELYKQYSARKRYKKQSARKRYKKHSARKQYKKRFLEKCFI